MASSFQNPRYHSKNTIDVTASALLTVSRLLDTGFRPNVSNKDFLPQAGKSLLIDSIVTNTKTKLQGVDHRRHFAIAHSHCDIEIRAGVGIVTHIAVGALIETSLFDRCIRRKFH